MSANYISCHFFYQNVNILKAELGVEGLIQHFCSLWVGTGLCFNYL